MIVVLPWPDRLASPNGRGNPWKVAGVKKKMREDAAWAALDAMNRCGWPRHRVIAAQVQAVFYHDPKHKQRRDRDNHASMLKAYLDGFADIGVIVNDEGFVPMPVRFEPSTDRRVEIEITAMETEACAAQSISAKKPAKRSANSARRSAS